jgi:hypothetical protein
VAQAGLVVALFGGSQALISRYAANPASVAARLREGLPVNEAGQPLAIGGTDVPERGYRTTNGNTVVEGPRGALNIIARDSRVEPLAARHQAAIPASTKNAAGESPRAPKRQGHGAVMMARWPTMLLRSYAPLQASEHQLEVDRHRHA